jgi:hypothetical protein
MEERHGIWRVLLIVVLVAGGLVVLSIVFAMLGWWGVIFQ